MSNPVLITLRTTSSDRALVTQLERGEARTSFALPVELAEHPDLGAPLVRLQGSLTGVAQGLADIAGNYSEAGFMPIALERTGSIAPDFRLVIEAHRSTLRRLEGDRRDLHAPTFDESVPHARRIEMRTHVRGLKPEAVLAMAKLEPVIAAAIVEGGLALSGLPEQAFKALEREAAVAKLADRILDSNRGTMRIAPSVNDPVGGALDTETARRNATDRLERLDDEIALLGLVPALLAGVLTAVSVLTGENRQSVLERFA